jgi:peptidoglycan/xylan/chitin deacetylase (PgdA/CDA1 family)
LIHFDRKSLSTAEFEAHLKLITTYGNPISLEEAITRKNLPPHPVVLTFDDGYKNNYTCAFPILKKYNIPATIFVMTGFIDRTTYLWSDRLEFIIKQAPSENIEFSWEKDRLILELHSNLGKIKSFQTIRKYLKELSEQQKLSFIEKLQQMVGIEYNWSKVPEQLLPLTWEQINEMKGSGLIAIGSHTVTHPILSQCTLEQQRHELSQSQLRIRQETGTECNLFAYPNGRITDFNSETIRLLKELKYLGAVTVVHGYVTENRDNFQLSRFGGDISLEALGTIVSGLSRLVGTI